MIDQAVRAGTLAELQADGPAAHQGRLGAGRRVLARRRGLRDRGPLPAPRLPAPPGHGRGRPRHLPLAPRPLRPRVGLHPRHVGRRRPRLRGRGARRRGVRRAARRRRPGRAPARRACATASRTSITLVIAKSVLGLLDAGVPRRPTSCAPASTSARRTAARAGARASPCSSRWPTSSPTSTATTARSRSCTAWRSSRTTPATSRPASPSARCRRGPCRWTRLAALVPPLHRHPLERLRRAHAARPR